MEEVRFYRYGEGADSQWCFVRLPSNYGRSSAPHPYVICNHGNGWTMGGSERTANFTSKTQYGVDRQRDGYYLSASADGFRLYSNPLIEALLEEGLSFAVHKTEGISCTETSVAGKLAQRFTIT
ncbi:hypothetical protein [Paenibacillus ginsengarvi]|uniref:Uncharacterized protein n=1 Tax=Paenibacillus ginsengarvi TaxID=400777 RepID=A0A3B0BUI5_9BACL|nr:hypothetical protein [Paenibacillus ginsengarvi]RKN75879.1 hypothetical protein D7M11_25585 [Paenibacillus ginsengarvi]